MSALLVILALVATISLEVIVGVMLYRRWRSYRELETSKAPSPEMLLRILLFTLFAIAAICLAGILFLVRMDTATTQVLLSLMPLAAFLTLGVQKDIIEVWLRWRAQPIESELHSVRSSHRDPNP